jgi:hypothetical protein
VFDKPGAGNKEKEQEDPEGGGEGKLIVVAGSFCTEQGSTVSP